MDARTKHARILIVDDDEDDFIITGEYINSIPGNAYKLDWCNNYNDGIRHLLAREYDLYFVDYRLGAKSGVDFLKAALTHNCDEPIILLTGKGNYEVDLQAMQLGAVDYLTKTDLSVEKMERCIRYALERSATLKALRTSERKYRSIFEKSKDVVFVTDHHLRFLDVNAAVSALLGFEQQEMFRMTLADLVEQPQQKALLQRATEMGSEVNDWEITLNTKSGEKKIGILTLTPEENNSDGTRIQGIIHDITNLKKMEKATLQGEKLAAAGRLVRTIAHEVRNPLNNITLSVEQIQHDVKDDSMEMYMGIIQRNAKRISDLISELLNTSRPTEIVMEKQKLYHVLEDVITASFDRLTLKKIALKKSFDRGAREVMADREKLKLALLNIVINSIEAMSETTGQLSISLDEHDGKVVLKISDNGCGIAEENISRLFEPYFTQKRNGVGLGLTFTLNILQAHKADIEVTSEIGKGTTFTIRFPVA